MSRKVLMKCGHSVTVEIGFDPLCPICYGIKPGAVEMDPIQPELIDRRARCSYCKGECDSSLDLPFFEHRPSYPFDDYYCGCKGWN